jgi:hypothetical protein
MTKKRIVVAGIVMVQLLLYYNLPSAAQARDQPIVLVPEAGDTVNAIQLKHYSLLPGMDGYTKAVFYLNQDSTVRVRVFFEQLAGVNDTIVQLRRRVRFLQNQIAQIGPILNTAPPADDEEPEDEMQRSGVGCILEIETTQRYTLEGELLSVRNDALVINTGAIGDTLLFQNTHIRIVKNEHIKTLFLHGSTPFGRSLRGAFFGLLIGYAVGVIDGLLNPKSYGNEKYQPVASPVQIAALLLGPILGLLYVREPYVELHVGDPKDCARLRKNARFPETESPCLQKIRL